MKKSKTFISNSVKNKIRNKIQLLYPNNADHTLDKILEEISKFKEHIISDNEKPKSQTFSHKDIVLITYADHIKSSGEKSLVVLKNFLSEYKIKEFINKLHILPFYPYTSDEGFSVVDYYKIKKEFGNWKDISNIAKDFDLMFDFVINHISQKSIWFKEFLKNNPKYSNYFIAFDHLADTSRVFRPRTHPLLTTFKTKKGIKYVWTTFSQDQIDLNFANEEVLLEAIKILIFYIKNGAKIIRLDAIGYLWKELGTQSIHLPQTHEIIKLFRLIIDEIAPDVWIITETNVPHNDNVSYFGDGRDEAHLVYNFTLPPLLLLTFLNKDSTRLTRWASTLEFSSPKSTFFNFTSSHDGIGVTPLKGIVPDREIKKLADYVLSVGGKINYRTWHGKAPQPYELNIVYLSAMGESIDAFLASQAIALSLRGVPAVYLNSLIGETNWKEGVKELGYNRAINRRRFDYEKLKKELNNNLTKKSMVFSSYRKLLEIRKNEPLFNPSVPQEILFMHNKIFSLIRSDDKKNKLLIIVNISDSIVNINASKLNFLDKLEGYDLLTNMNISLRKNLNISPYQIMWIKII